MAKKQDNRPVDKTMGLVDVAGGAAGAAIVATAIPTAHGMLTLSHPIGAVSDALLSLYMHKSETFKAIKPQIEKLREALNEAGPEFAEANPQITKAANEALQKLLQKHGLEVPVIKTKWDLIKTLRKHITKGKELQGFVSDFVGMISESIPKAEINITGAMNELQATLKSPEFLANLRKDALGPLFSTDSRTFKKLKPLLEKLGITATGFAQDYVATQQDLLKEAQASLLEICRNHGIDASSPEKMMEHLREKMANPAEARVILDDVTKVLLDTVKLKIPEDANIELGKAYDELKATVNSERFRSTLRRELFAPRFTRKSETAKTIASAFEKLGASIDAFAADFAVRNPGIADHVTPALRQVLEKHGVDAAHAASPAEAIRELWQKTGDPRKAVEIVSDVAKSLQSTVNLSPATQKIFSALEELKTATKSGEYGAAVAKDGLYTFDLVMRKTLGTYKFKNAEWYEKPLIAFEAMSTKGKVCLGATVAASALGIAYGINQARTSKLMDNNPGGPTRA